ncbi:MAG TPA: hypothetical protein PLR25_08720 [Planctomycetaceae bacterium]|nr:hypothetical protein [Planctomycetaceae bacterium]
MQTRLFAAFLIAVIATVVNAGPPIGIEHIQRAEPIAFDTEVLPILQKNCLACHSATEKQGELVLESPQAMLKGGGNGAAVVAGKGAESLLVKMASHQVEPVMPPEGNDVAAKNLTPQELGLIKLWIDQGARGTGGIESISPKQMRSLPKSIAAVQGVTLTQDGQYVAFGRGNQILLHHVPTGQLITELKDAALASTSGGAHRDLVQSLTFNVDGDLLASGGFRESKLWRRPRDVQKLNIAAGGPASIMVVSADHKWIAANGPDNTVRLFNAIDGTAGPVFTGHTNVVTSLRFTGDSLRLVSGSLDQSICLWNVADGTLAARIETPASINAVELVMLENATNEKPSPEQWIVTGHADNLIRVWTFPTAEVPVTMPLREIKGHGGSVSSLASIPQNPRQVISGSVDNTIRRWNLDNGQQMQQYNHGGPVVAVAVAPGAQRIASASENHTAKLFNINGQQIAEMRGDIRRRISLTRARQQETATNTRLTVAKRLADAAEKDLPIKTTAEKTLSEKLTGANADVEVKKIVMETAFTEKTDVEKSAIDASGAAKTALAEKQQAEHTAKEAAAIVVVIQAKLNRLTQASNGAPQNEELKQKVIAAQAEMGAATKASMEMAAAVKVPTDKAAEMSNLANEVAKKLVTVQKPYNDAVAALKVAEATQNLLSQQQAIAAKELQVATDLVPIRKDALTQVETLLAEANAAVEAANKQLQESDLAIRSVAFSPDGVVLATGGDFPSIHTWDAQTGSAIAAFAGHSAAIKSITFIDDRTLVSASDDQSVRIWDSNPGWILERTIGSIDDPNLIPHRVTSVDFNEDSTQLLIAGGIPSRRGELQIFNVADGSRVLYLPQAHDDVVYSARFSPDGKRIASGGADKYLRTFDVATSQQLRRFEGHTNYVLGVAWKRDGNVIASCGADDTIKIWDAETGDQQRTITQNFNRHVTAISYVGETDNLISSCGDKLARLHNAANGGLARNFGNAKTWLHCIAVTPDNNVVAAGDAAGNVYLWNGNNGQQLKVLSLLPTAGP